MCILGTNEIHKYTKIYQLSFLEIRQAKVNVSKGQLLINKKTWLYFLDEACLADAWQVNLSRLKIKTRFFVD